MATVPVFECGPSGGTGGDPFHDEIPAAGVTVANIRVFSGRNASVGSSKYLNSIQLFYSDHSQTVRHGHAKGTRRDIALVGQEHIVELSGFYGLFIDQLTIRTSNNRNLGPFGGNGGTGSSGIMFLMAWRLLGFPDHLETVWMRSAYFTAQFRASHRAATPMPSSSSSLPAP
jgi:Jacalin-like lectin domain